MKRLFAGVVMSVLLLCALQARADLFLIQWTGGYGPGSVTVGATNEGGGAFLITSFVGTQAGMPITLEPTNTYGLNTNLIFPGGGPSGSCAPGVSPLAQLDNCGFTFTDGINLYNVFSAQIEPDTYWECNNHVTPQPNCVDAHATPGLELTSFSITREGPVPEPSSLALLTTGLATLVGAARRKHLS